ncbi:MAG: phosphoribosylformylglycinamidine synthase subunit PurQ [Planctomycetota bacterium]
MPAPRVLVVRAPGTNSDEETALAFERSGGAVDLLHLFRVLERPAMLDDYQIFCVPGGFSYGDDLGSGVIFARHLTGPLGEALGRFLAADKLILGICNGFQTLLKAGVLPNGAADWGASTPAPARATLTWNESGRYDCRWVRLRVDRPDHAFLRGMGEVEMPIAHAEGRIAVSDPSVLDGWLKDGNVALRYAPRKGELTNDPPSATRTLPAPDNPNGSFADIAGLSDPSGKVLGLMPHPERFQYAHHHPRWTRLGLTGDGAGLKLFQNAVQWFA